DSQRSGQEGNFVSGSNESPPFVPGSKTGQTGTPEKLERVAPHRDESVPASGDGSTPGGHKPLEMRGGDFQERHWEQLSDRRKAALKERLSESQLFDPKPPEVMRLFLDEVNSLCSEWHHLTGREQLQGLQAALNDLTRNLEPPLPDLNIRME